MSIKQNNFKYFHLCLACLATLFCSFDVQSAPRSRASASKTTVARTKIPATQTVVQNETTEQNSSEDEDIVEPEPESSETDERFEGLENKASQFSSVLEETNSDETSNSDMAEKIRKQRASLDAKDNIAASNAVIKSGKNACDTGLRECMKGKCGTDFTKCATDGDTDFGNKLNSCKLKLQCNATEFTKFSTAIKEDRDANVKLASYNEIINCGNNYNKCIIKQCGNTFNKCLGKAAGDKAISDCKKIADNCKTADSGLNSRILQVFGSFRQDAEKQIAADEKKLYALRDKMESTCNNIGAMFDTRTFDCVFTVNFFANSSTTPYASKKAYAGNSFDCTQNWFGIDITTFKENAYRETRAQTAASSAMLGAGVGSAVGMVTSGAIGRAVDTQKAKKALDKAKDANKETKSGDDKDSLLDKAESLLGKNDESSTNDESLTDKANLLGLTDKSGLNGVTDKASDAISKKNNSTFTPPAKKYTEMSTLEKLEVGSKIKTGTASTSSGGTSFSKNYATMSITDRLKANANMKNAINNPGKK